MAEKAVTVTQSVRITYDESKFTEEWMAEFRSYMYSFETIDNHLKYLSQLAAVGIWVNTDSFLEGYGIAKDFGLNFEIEDIETEIE